MPSTVKKHPGRKRRIGGWMLLSLAILVTGVWAASGWWELSYTGSVWQWAINSGEISAVHVKIDATFPPNAWHLQPTGQSVPRFLWAVDPALLAGFGRGSTWNLWVACGGDDQVVAEYWFYPWPLPLLLTAAGLPLLRSGVMARRRAMAGSCPTCGYDRRGLPAAAVCPECGKG